MRLRVILQCALLRIRLTVKGVMLVNAINRAHKSLKGEGHPFVTQFQAKAAPSSVSMPSTLGVFHDSAHSREVDERPKGQHSNCGFCNDVHAGFVYMVIELTART